MNQAHHSKCLALGLLALACAETRDLGSTAPRGLLPIDERNPVVLANDGVYDNWQGEYAMLLANDGGARLAGIIVSTSPPWPDIEANVAGWRSLVTAASGSGLRGIPDPITSIGARLVRPASGQIPDTLPNRSEGARLIVDLSHRLGLPYRPLVVVTGGRLTDLADAFLIDPTVSDRVVVVSSLGSVTPNGGSMGAPNGEMDPWADWIVAAHFRFVQVSAFYDQTSDLPASRLGDLPQNSLGAWMSAKQPLIWSIPDAADQVGILAVSVPSFAREVQRSAPSSVGPAATAGADLVAAAEGNAWLVRAVSSTEAVDRIWRLLREPNTDP